MAAKRAPRQDQRQDTIFLRAIGSLALASTALSGILRDGQDHGEEWRTPANRLLADAARVMEAANDATHTGGPVVIQRQGARVPITVAYLDRLTEQIHRLTQVGLAQKGAIPPSTSARENAPDSSPGP